MIVDHNNFYTTNEEILTEISQFISCLNNKLISQNVNFAKTIGFDVDPNAEFNAQLVEEINEYKVYDC